MDLNIKRIVVGLIIIVALAFLIFNEYGLLKYFQLKNKVSSLEEEINSSKIQIENLLKEIDSLRNSKIKLEQLAREKYHMKSEDEKVLRVEEKNN